jgi:hypothetical protein
MRGRYHLACVAWQGGLRSEINKWMIVLNFCVACGDPNPDHLQQHHLVPRACGGSDGATNKITLCAVCHGKMHGIKRSLNHKALVKAGHARAKARGVRIGRPLTLTAHQQQEAIQRLSNGETQTDVARSYNVITSAIKPLVD